MHNPSKSILDQAFKYVNSAATDVAKTFARVRAEQAVARAKVCKHCGREIVHTVGRLWHEVGAKVFPQYCVNFGDLPIDQLHEIDTRESQGEPEGVGDGGE